MALVRIQTHQTPVAALPLTLNWLVSNHYFIFRIKPFDTILRVVVLEPLHWQFKAL
jgi:hypothetical protein